MVMPLCRSWYKFVWFSDRPFTSETHEKAFGYFHHITRFIIYNQDVVFLYDEHFGDYRITTVFGCTPALQIISHFSVELLHFSTISH